MTATITEAPKALKPYLLNGLNLDYQSGEQNATGECPFCGSSKFGVDVNTAQYNCFKCGEGGSFYQYLEKLHADSFSETSIEDYQRLAEDRGLENPETLVLWGWAKNVLNDSWICPGYRYNFSKKRFDFRQLYRYEEYNGKKQVLACSIPTATKKGTLHTLFGITPEEMFYSFSKSTVVVCEGPWDAMRLWEVMSSTKSEDGHLKATANQAHSMVADTSIVAVPGANVFQNSWADYFQDKDVTLMFDNDHPKKLKNNKVRKPVGTEGMKRASIRMADKPDIVSYLNWGPKGYSKKLPDNYDLRDVLGEGDDPRERLNWILNKIEEIPDKWRADIQAGGGEGSLEPIPCSSWNELLEAWKKALQWTEGLEHGLACMLAVIASTRSAGDQLWIKVIGPASCGKSTLCEAVGVARQFVISKSTIRGFHSGFGSDRSEDNSLIARLNNNTLVVKDGDTLLQAPNRAQILAEGRDIYDGVSRSDYRNGMGKNYEGFRTTWILCGTASLRAIDSSELGERFLDCVIMDRVDHDEEQDILMRKVLKSIQESSIETTEDSGNAQYSEELATAMALTGGYVEWLKSNVTENIGRITRSIPDNVNRAFTNYATFVAYMRARPSGFHQEKGEREVATRLCGQHVKAGIYLAYVMNKEEIDDEVLDRVRALALATGRGVVLDFVQAMIDYHPDGANYTVIRTILRVADKDRRSYLRFMEEIDLLVQFQAKGKRGSKKVTKWRVTEAFTKIFNCVVNGEDPTGD